ncbi:hypothetical protein NQ318_009667, partial [Aromia moschata]
NHIGALFQLKEINRESAPELREILDITTGHLRSLQALGPPVNEWDSIIVYLITKKLDKQTARHWESYKTSSDIPTLDEFKTFLNNKANMLDNLRMCHNESKHTDDRKSKKSFVVSNIICYCCKGSHGIFRCDTFFKLPAKQLIVKSENQVTLSTHTTTSSAQVLLATAQVEVRDNQGTWQSCRALLDSASQSCFITAELHSKLGVIEFKSNISNQGISQVISQIKSQCKVHLKSRINIFNTELKCLIIDKISDDIPSIAINTDRLRLPENLQLADPDYDVPNKIDLLIGHISLGKNLPSLQNTMFGWVISGLVQMNSFENELEECPSMPAFSFDEQRCEAHFKDNFYKDETGRYVVSIPFKDTTETLGESRSIAEKIFLSLGKRLSSNPHLNKAYI